MNKKALSLLLVGLFCFASMLGAASTWEGSAVIGGLEDFPSDDLFGACNSFPVNSSVEVENLDNGKKVSVIISQTIDNPAVFMALSPKAAATLGMKRGAAARVRILAAPAVSTSAPRPALAPGATADPDYNPSVLAYAKPSAEKTDSSKGTELSSLLGASPKGAAASSASADIAEVAAPEDAAPVAAAPEARVPATPALVEPAVAAAPSAPATEAPKAAEAAAPTEEAASAAPAEATASAAPAAEAEKPAEVADVEPELAAEPEAAAEAAPAEPVAAAEATESAETAESAEAAAPAAAEPAVVAAAEPEAPAEPAMAESPDGENADVVLSLEPTAARPPVAEAALAAPESAAATEAPAAVAPAAGAPAAVAPIASPSGSAVAAKPASVARVSHPAQDPVGVPRIESLAKGYYYVQIGVYATDEALKAAIAAFSSGKYPIAYERLEGRATTTEYRIYVGPILRDESGLLLKKIQAMGFKDAFLKKAK
jgi:hypothetical protein